MKNAFHPGSAVATAEEEEAAAEGAEVEEAGREKGEGASEEMHVVCRGVQMQEEQRWARRREWEEHAAQAAAALDTGGAGGAWQVTCTIQACAIRGQRR